MLIRHLYLYVYKMFYRKQHIRFIEIVLLKCRRKEYIDFYHEIYMKMYFKDFRESYKFEIHMSCSSVLEME